MMEPLEYALNRMEVAAQSSKPAEMGYGDARQGLIRGIEALCAENEQLREENDNLSSHVDAMNEEMLRIETFMKGTYMNDIVATPTYGSISSATIYDIYRRRAGKEG